MKGHPLFAAINGPDLGERAAGLGFSVGQVLVGTMVEAFGYMPNPLGRAPRAGWFRVLTWSAGQDYFALDAKPETALAWLLLYAGAAADPLSNGERCLSVGPSSLAGDVYPGALLLDDLAAAAHSQAGARAEGWPRVNHEQVQQFSQALALLLDGWAEVTGNRPRFEVQPLALECDGVPI